MNDTTETQRLYVACRLSTRIKDAMDRAAADDDRTTSGLLRKIVSEWLKEKGYLK